MILEAYLVLCMTEPGFLKKNFCLNNGENGPKIGFFKFIGKIRHEVFLNLVYKESLYYLQYSCI